MNVHDSSPEYTVLASESGSDLPATVVELGAHSLKIHSLRAKVIHTRKFPYDLGREVFSTGRLSETTVRRVVEHTRLRGVYPITAIGTSALRDAENARELIHRLENGLGVTVYVLTCWEEASLLANGYLAASKRLPALIADIGGGSLQIVYLNRTRNVLWDSLPLGVIRVHHRFRTEGNSRASDWIDDKFARASVVMADEIYATGGTVKAIAKTLKRATVERHDVADLADRVRTEGPPAALNSSRARVFLAGLTVVRKLFEITRAQRIHYVDISVGRVFMSLTSGQPLSQAQ